MKREVRRKLRKWRKGRGQEKVYRKGKREYKELCEWKRREETEEWRRAEEAKTEGQVWKIINSEKKRRKRVNEGIEMSEWKRFFMDVLGGVEGKVRMGKEKSRER